jgi:mannose-6-phosphate isomerase-like protein (cupin superfamily)
MYGIAIDHLDELIESVPPEPGKLRSLLTARAEYALEKLLLRPGDEHEVATSPGEGATIFAEAGALHADPLAGAHKRVHVASGSRVRLRASELTSGYIFRGPAGPDGETAGFPATFDLRSKYWGSIESIVNAGYTGKRLFFRRGKHSSLHFHCAKMETYFIHSGRLLVRLRAGRGQDRWFPLAAGTLLHIPPGLMHQSGALEDTVIMEVSTHDEDADSFLVEDGERFPMPRLQAMLGQDPVLRQRIVFDLDGCLCSQTAGDYEHAQPNPRAIALVNRLYDCGHEITIHTARFMGRNGNNAFRAIHQGFAFTQQQLCAWGVRYHLLVMGKPAADLVVDDRSLFFRNDWERIAEEIEYTPGFHPLTLTQESPHHEAIR